MEERKRKIIVLRHGERVDLTFGKTWIQEDYVRTDLNMPEKVPKRQLDHWSEDSPLTKLGEFQAELVGASLRENGVKFSHVFVSPSYRCLQTAAGVLRGLGDEKEIKLNVEFGFFEWLGYYGDSLPTFSSDEEYQKFFNVNESYNSIVSRTEVLSTLESFDEFCIRKSRVSKEIYEKFDGNILIVGHASNLDLCTREFIGLEFRPRLEFRKLQLTTSYLAAVAMEQTGSSFEFIEPPCLSLTHDNVSTFNWKTMQGTFVQDPNVLSVTEKRNQAIALYVANSTNVTN